MDIQTPEWVKNAIFYQIFPDRFNRSSRLKHPRGIEFKPWGSPPAEQGYQGGDLLGVVDQLDYLKDLGINAIYLNPIFSAATNHRYNAYDYLQVDPLLGGNAALRELLDEAHQRQIRVILDGVFNHCGRGFWAFHHILENGPASPYVDWFHIHGYPLRAYPEDRNNPHPNYVGWWGHPSLPKFNTNNPGVRDYLFQVTRFWLEFGIDGWRLDVPGDIQDDSFWQEFRQIVKSVNPDAYIVGEIWHEARHWLQGDMFDAVMNYIITGPILNFFGSATLNQTWKHDDVKLQTLDATGFAAKINSMYALYDWQINYAQMNMLDSHDMPRALWLVGNDKKAFKLAVLCQMSMPGAPSVYYGDEVGLSAGGDPHCREAFPWHQPERWDTDLLSFYRMAIGLRNEIAALRTGDLAFVLEDGQCLAYRRRLGGQEVIVAFNAGKDPVILDIRANHLKYANYEVRWPAAAGRLATGPDGLTLELEAQSVVILVAEG